ncbi:hypothetical protein P5G51_015595 [Virgibacillus sp. 179-BFC.A HS]|uniref:Uncharacterized protein n=1 Tax=Tigheibacillus jepli TaxID=3035914 RepID=A0ABU5CJR9_9BACI|nr:hypothetical protein [Virgibacillus sp. 179-BFC.A HS]MDY0406596.1 hypothetical protein [Virgibacillus sp. 179-BFC.A HS]
MSYTIKENGRNSLDGLEKAEDVIEWLKKNGYEKEANVILKRKIFHAILADFLNFVLESLKASEKGKTSISYALLRKPFKDNLLYLEWLISDGNELLHLVESESTDEYEIGKIRRYKRWKLKSILQQAMDNNEFKDHLHILDSKYMYELRYDYNAPLA